MLKEWNQNCPRIRKARTGAVMGEVTLLDDELPVEFGGPRDTIVLDPSPHSDMDVYDPADAYKLKQPMTGLHIEMALCLHHDGFRDTFWARHLNSRKNLQNRTEDMLAKEPKTPCAIDLLVGAVEHLAATLTVPIWTPGDEMFANQAMLADADLVQRTHTLLHELLFELRKVQREPGTPDATGFLRSRLLRQHRSWDDYHASFLAKQD
ncbi:unnamed protein product [Effrenium voratum]|nr:unnamed protein product [Effrenium voratum]